MTATTSLTHNEIEAEIARLSEENAKLRSQIRAATSKYAQIGVFTFPGKTAWKREATNLGLPCSCQAYVDVLTAGRWRALSRHVKAGESAVHRAGRLGNTPLFCRCQTAPDWGTDDIELQADQNEYGEIVDLTSIPF